VTRTNVIIAIGAVALIALGALAISAYSQPELDTSNPLGLLSPLLAAIVPSLAAIATNTVPRFKKRWLALAGAILAALYYVIPLLIGLQQQSATSQQIALAATFISWLGTAAGLLGAAVAGIVLGIHQLFENRKQRQEKARIVHIIEQEVRAANGSATAIELGPAAYAVLTRDWGDDATSLVISRKDGRLIGLASERWPAQATVPMRELRIHHGGESDHIRVLE
jgi:hypothetical protein